MIERATVMKTLNGSLKVRDASFSSYLRPNEPISFPQQHITAGHVQCARIDDSAAELSIFDAHKYFNELSSSENQKVVTISSNSRVSPLANASLEHSPDRSDYSSVQHRHSSASSTVDGYANIRSYRTRSFHAATPTASSEASWNSQTGLLSHPPGAIAVSMRSSISNADSNKKSRPLISTPRWIFRRKCPCSGKKSVEVRDNLKNPTPQISTPSLQPRLSSHSQVSTSAMMQLKKQEPHNHNSPNASVEKLTLHMEKATLKPSQTSNPHENFITPHNWVDQKQPEHIPMIMSDSHKSSPPEKPFSPTTIPPQRVMASGRAFVDHAAAGFTFPILNQNLPSIPSTTTRLQSVDEDPPRDSLEVFRPPAEKDSNFASRKNITRDHQNFTFTTSPKSRIIDDDVASDASSDLFEIESFSTQSTSTYPMIYRHRDSLDEASNFDPTKRLGTPSGTVFLYGRRSLDETSSVTPTITECYEPSEASIEWSVTTAEGFDRASITNYSVTASELADHNELLNMKEYHQRQSEKNKRRNSSANGLLSCRSEKAVSVGPRPVKCVPSGEGHKGATHLPLKPHVSSRPVAENKPPLARSHSARLSLAFAT